MPLLEENIINLPEEKYANKEKRKIKKENIKEEIYQNLEETTKKILEDIQYKGIIARVLKKNFEEREFIGEKEWQELILLKDLMKNKDLKKTFEIQILPIAKKGYKWEDKQSKRLRKRYIKKAHKLAEIIENLSLEGISNAEEILLKSEEIYEKTTAFLEFSNAVGLVDKGPKRKKKTPVSLSLLFKEMYFSGERALVFGLFEGFSEKGKEFLLSSLAIHLLDKNAQGIDKNNILDWLNKFAHIADLEIKKISNGFSGVGATYGVVLNKKMYFVNLGNNAIYGINGGNTITISEPQPEFINDRNKMLSSLKYPYFFLGTFSQKIKFKKQTRIIQNPFKLKEPHIMEYDLNGIDQILIVNSGVWKSRIELKTNGIRMINFFDNILKRSKNIVSTAERINMYAKKRMKENKNKYLEGDVGVLIFQV